jgi:hypothetical protein
MKADALQFDFVVTLAKNSKGKNCVVLKQLNRNSNLRLLFSPDGYLLQATVLLWRK